MKSRILAIILLFSVETLTAQTIVRGRILNQQKEPVVAATIQIIQSDSQRTGGRDTMSRNQLVKIGTSDKEGKYELPGVPAGNFRLEVSSIGYQAFSDSLLTGKDQPVVERPDILLQGASHELREVSVTRRRRIIEVQADRNVLNVQNSITAVGSSVLAVISGSPNIDVDRMNNQIVMNGKQGVIVMINGKQLRMEPAAVIQYLEGLPAANVKKIEFIHTPPASFDAAGNAGIINIVLLKSEEDGLNGSINPSYGYGIRPKYDLAGNIDYHKGRISIQADFSSSNNFTSQNLLETTSSVSGNTTTDIYLDSRRPVYLGVQNGKINLDYKLTDKTSLGVGLSGYVSNWQLEASTSTITQTSKGDYNLSRLKSSEVNYWKHYMTSLSLQHHFSERKMLSLDFDYLNFNDRNPTNYENHDFDKAGNKLDTSFFYSRKNSPVDFKVGQIDYKEELKPGLSMEAGMKSSYSNFANDVRVTNLVNGSLVVDNRFTSVLTNQESIYAGYLSADYKINGSTTAKLGVRYEYDKSNLDSLGIKRLVHLDYGKFFPTLAFSRRFENNGSLQVAYNERITRPGFGALAPAFFFFGPNNVVAGNPAVQATSSRQLTTSYQIGDLTVTAQYSRDKNPMLFQPRTDTAENIVLLRYENMKSQSTAMLSVSYATSKNKWSSQTSVAFFGQQVQPVYQGVVQTRNDFYINFNTTQTLQLPDHFSVELSDQIRTSRNFGFGKSPFQMGLNIGIQKSLNERNKVSLTWYDITRQNSFFGFNYDQPQLNMIYHFHGEYEGSFVKLSYSYRFGKKFQKRADARKSISEEEMKRVN